jgi:arylsulfatase A-like enzyme
MMSALSEGGFYDNTLFIATGDNGGAPKNGGYNYPLRGSKGTLFEGGVRQASWVWGEMLPDSVRGTIDYNHYHVTDFFPTIMSVATAGMWKPNYFYELDGMDVWGTSHALVVSLARVASLSLLLSLYFSLSTSLSQLLSCGALPPPSLFFTLTLSCCIR